MLVIKSSPLYICIRASTGGKPLVSQDRISTTTKWKIIIAFIISVLCELILALKNNFEAFDGENACTATLGCLTSSPGLLHKLLQHQRTSFLSNLSELIDTLGVQSATYFVPSSCVSEFWVPQGHHLTPMNHGQPTMREPYWGTDSTKISHTAYSFIPRATVHILHLYVEASLLVHSLTHLPLVLHICISESGQLWFR